MSEWEVVLCAALVSMALLNWWLAKMLVRLTDDLVVARKVMYAVAEGKATLVKRGHEVVALKN